MRGCVYGTMVFEITVFVEEFSTRGVYINNLENEELAIWRNAG